VLLCQLVVGRSRRGRYIADSLPASFPYYSLLQIGRVSATAWEANPE
jgi:hypothetical protein